MKKIQENAVATAVDDATDMLWGRLNLQQNVLDKLHNEAFRELSSDIYIAVVNRLSDYVYISSID